MGAEMAARCVPVTIFEGDRHSRSVIVARHDSFVTICPSLRRDSRHKSGKTNANHLPPELDLTPHHQCWSARILALQTQDVAGTDAGSRSRAARRIPRVRPVAGNAEVSMNGREREG